MLFRSLLVFILCIPFEIRDEEKERVREIDSLLKYGRSKLLAVVTVCVLVLLILQWSMHIRQLIDSVEWLSLSVPLVVAVMWMFLARPYWPGWIFKLAIDGTMLLPFLLISLRNIVR